MAGKWIKGGCLGCLGVVAFVSVALALVLGVSLSWDPPDPERTRRESERPLPGSPGAGGEAGGGEVVSDAEVEGRELPPVEGVAGVPPLEGVEPLVLELDLGFGTFDLEAGEPGTGVRVIADYDRASYRFEESFDEAENRMRVRFGTRGGLFGIFGVHEPAANRVRIVVPRGYPVVLTGKIGIGESDLQLGGLAVQEVDLEYGIGDHHLEFAEPLPRPLERFAVDGSIGELLVRSLGNASPREAFVESGIGELVLELDGAWKNDSRVRLSHGIGEVVVRVPEEVRLSVDSSLALGGTSRGDLDRAEPPEGAHEIELEVSSGIGEVVIDG